MDLVARFSENMSTNVEEALEESQGRYVRSRQLGTTRHWEIGWFPTAGILCGTLHGIFGVDRVENCINIKDF